MAFARYFRFRGTALALRDCREHIHDDLIAGSIAGEHAARAEIIQLCAEILEETTMHRQLMLECGLSNRGERDV